MDEDLESRVRELEQEISRLKKDLDGLETFLTLPGFHREYISNTHLRVFRLLLRFLNLTVPNLPMEKFIDLVEGHELDVLDDLIPEEAVRSWMKARVSEIISEMLPAREDLEDPV